MMRSRHIDSFLDAAHHGRLDHVKDFISEYGPNCNDHIHNDPYGEAILLACRNRKNTNAFEVVKYILDHGGQPNFVNQDKFSPLIYAAMSNNVKLAKLLLQHGADVNFKSSKRTVPLVWASMHQGEEMAQLLYDYNADIKLTKDTYVIGPQQHHFLKEQYDLYRVRKSLNMSKTQQAFEKAKAPPLPPKPPSNDDMKADPISLKRRPKSP